MNNYLQFLDPHQDVSIAYLSTYSVPLVILSVLMAMLASFVALHLTGRIQQAATNGGKVMWLISGSLAMGGGIWAMHFIGMLAFSLPCGIFYDPIMTFVSMIPGVMASAVALWTISRPDISLRHLCLGGVLMGGGIGAMHYSGMAAMRLDGIIYYSPVLFGISIVVAIALAVISLYVKFALQSHERFRLKWFSSTLGAVIMGIAISGMHYVAMEAAYFLPIDNNSSNRESISPSSLAIGITASVTMLMLMTFVSAVRARFLETITELRSAIVTREHAERELSERITELNFQKFALDEHAIVSITDIKGNITYANDKFCDISGYSREELLGRSHRILNSGEHSPEFFKSLWQTITNGKAWHGEIKNIKKDGGEYWVKATIVPFLDKNGKPFQYVAIRTDITKSKRDELNALAASVAKSHLLANMSHELRTPLNAIIGFSSFMQAEMFGPVGHEKYREYLDDINNSGKHLLELINDILDASAMEQGAIKLREENVAVANVINEIVRLLMSSAERGKVTIISHVDQKSPTIYADRRRFKQIIINLLSNAVKFTPEGGVVTVNSLLNDDNSFSIFVSDTGLGMSDEEIDIALTAFGQVDNGLDRMHEGTGLGLPLTNGLMDLHSGTLEIESIPAYGTVVTVTFPKERVIQNI